MNYRVSLSLWRQASTLSAFEFRLAKLRQRIAIMLCWKSVQLYCREIHTGSRQRAKSAGSLPVPKGAGEQIPSPTTMIETAKLFCVDPQASLSDVLSRIADHKIICIDELLP